jgi:hypothetical protein
VLQRYDFFQKQKTMKQKKAGNHRFFCNFAAKSTKPMK